MSDDEINAAIAESLGWALVGTSIRAGRPPEVDYIGNEFIPKYCEDLNLMWKAEEWLLTSDPLYEYRWQDYLSNIFQVIHKYQCEHERDRMRRMIPPKWVPHASARHRAEAFLRTLKKWKGQP